MTEQAVVDRTRAALEIGRKIRLTEEVERYPLFTARKGMTGTIVNLDADSEGTLREIWARMDEHIDGAEDWDNEIQFGSLGDEEDAVEQFVREAELV